MKLILILNNYVAVYFRDTTLDPHNNVYYTNTARVSSIY